jgi:hypothetical protein
MTFLNAHKGTGGREAADQSLVSIQITSNSDCFFDESMAIISISVSGSSAVWLLVDCIDIFRASKIKCVGASRRSYMSHSNPVDCRYAPGK